mmetsp:Transcript_8755/g.14379  ORF Transcript_8755/g.14379 Transcript_8755/m.14379 type:complete len:128 (-) Transcript_8755:2014-2397(-)
MLTTSKILFIHVFPRILANELKSLNPFKGLHAPSPCCSRVDDLQAVFQASLQYSIEAFGWIACTQARAFVNRLILWRVDFATWVIVQTNAEYCTGTCAVTGPNALAPNAVYELERWQRKLDGFDIAK